MKLWELRAQFKFSSGALNPLSFTRRIAYPVYTPKNISRARGSQRTQRTRVRKVFRTGRILVTTTMGEGRQRATPEVVDLTGEEDVDRPADKRARTHPPRSSCLDTSLPFQLFRTRGIPAEYNDEQQGLGFDMEKAVAGEIKFAFVSVRHRSVPSCDALLSRSTSV